LCNVITTGLDNVKFSLSDQLDPTLQFAAIWSNPPIPIGKPALNELLTPTATPTSWSKNTSAPTPRNGWLNDHHHYIAALTPDSTPDEFGD
jgi:hypothetical protein